MSSEEEYLLNHRASGLKKGDIVRVTHKVGGMERGWNNMWNDTMDTMVGKTYKIIIDANTNGFSIGEIDSDIRIFDFPYFVLERANKYGKGVLIPIQDDRR